MGSPAARAAALDGGHVEYLDFLEALAAPHIADALRAPGGWAHCGAAMDGWAVAVLPSATLRPLRSPQLRPRLLRVRLPLNADAAWLPALLNGEGVAAAHAARQARNLLRRARRAGRRFCLAECA